MLFEHKIASKNKFTGPFTSKLRSGSRERRNVSPSPERGGARGASARLGRELAPPDNGAKRGVSPTPLGNWKKNTENTGRGYIF